MQSQIVAVATQSSRADFSSAMCSILNLTCLAMFRAHVFSRAPRAADELPMVGKPVAILKAHSKHHCKLKRSSEPVVPSRQYHMRDAIAPIANDHGRTQFLKPSCHQRSGKFGRIFAFSGCRAHHCVTRPSLRHSPRVHLDMTSAGVQPSWLPACQYTLRAIATLADNLAGRIANPRRRRTLLPARGGACCRS